MADPRFHTNQGPFSLMELVRVIRANGLDADLLHPEDAQQMVSDINTLRAAGENEITFLDNPKYRDSLSETKAAACILHPEQAEKSTTNAALIVTENPYFAYANVAHHFYPSHSPAFFEGDIHPTATIDDSATIMPGARIGADVTVGAGSIIHSNTVLHHGVGVGKDCVIYPNSTIQYSTIGDQVIIHPNVAIGQDGFGFATHNGRHLKVPQLGRVVIEDQVEIGAGTCIDRGAAPDTVIGEGTKIDNLVQIAHNVQIGKHCIIVAGVGISGSTKLGDYVVVGGQAGLTGHLSIGNHVRIAAQSGVMRNIPDGRTVGGSPAVAIVQHHRQQIALQQLAKKSEKDIAND